MFVLAASQAISDYPEEVAIALEGLTYMSPVGEVVMRKSDHQPQAPLFLGIWDKNSSNDVRHDSARTGYGFRRELS